MKQSTTFMLAALMAAANARRMPDPNCCTVWAGQYFSSHHETFCLEEGSGRLAAFEIEHARDVWRDGSIKCGTNVDAQICPGGTKFGPIDGQREFGYKCSKVTEFAEHGVKVGAGQQLGWVPMPREGSSIILSLHPWVAKGKEYLNLDREEKE